MTVATDQLQLVANTIRGLAMDAVQKADSGHPGMPMGMADVAAVLWTGVLRHSAKDAQWPGRDRFVLSAGHGSMLLYSLLHLTGYDVSLEDLKQFRQLHSRTPGHPEHGDTHGVETTTGPLGQGFGNGVGMAIAAQMEAGLFANPLLQNRVFGIVSDGDLMEGISSEAASLAGHLKLGNLVYLYDDNRITIEGHTDLAFSEDVPARFRAVGWHVQSIDGHDFDQIREALQKACAQTDRPNLICCRTTIGKGSPNKADSHESHGAPLGKDEVKLSKEALGLPPDDFHVEPKVRELFAAVQQENERLRQRWIGEMQAWEGKAKEQAAQWRAFRERRVPQDLLAQLVTAAGDAPSVATRVLSGNVIQKAAALVPGLVGGSADLDPSTKTRIKASGSFQARERSARNLHFGVREHAMGAILNGMALHGGFLPMGSTFLVFADYVRPSIRLAALMKLPVTFVFTHDSLMVGEDGPTHQPVEQIPSLRLIPNLHVFRPADGMETAAAWTHALSRRDGPVALALTRQNLPKLERMAGFAPEMALKGGYVLQEPKDACKAVIVATGAEVSLALEAVKLLEKDGVPCRVVSMPCVELFLAQGPQYLEQVLGKGIPRFALEMARPELWAGITGCVGRCIGQTGFGASGPYKQVAEHFGFTPAKVAARIKAAL